MRAILIQRQYLNKQLIAKLPTMTTEQHHQNKSILLRAYECKIKSKINIQQFLQIVNTDPRLRKISQKGLFIVYLCELLLKAYIANGLKIRNFVSELDKKDIKKRQRREGDGEPKRRKKNKSQNRRGQGKTLEQLSNQSLSNPSNVQRPRINVEKPTQSANQKDQLSKQKGDQSNGSKQNSRQNQLKIQLNKITQQIRGQQDTYVPDVDFLPGTTFEDNSQSSSSQNTGQISNLSEKIKIFTSIKQTQKRGTTTRRKTGNNGNLSRQTKTKKKKYDIIDQSTFIEETKVSENDNTFINYTEVSRFDTQEVIDLDLVKNFMGNLGKDQKSFAVEIFQKDKIQGLKAIIQIQNPIQTKEPNYIGGMMPMDQNYDMQYPDYTMSQPTSAPILEPDFFKQSLQIKDSQFNFDDLLSHSTKDKATLFYQLLWRQQNDEISMQQRQPERFSTIKVRHK